LAGEKNHGGFEDGEHQAQERDRDHPEFHGRGAVLIAREAPDCPELDHPVEAAPQHFPDPDRHRTILRAAHRRMRASRYSEDGLSNRCGKW